jgi:hypothetical protein
VNSKEIFLLEGKQAKNRHLLAAVQNFTQSKAQKITFY